MAHPLPHTAVFLQEDLLARHCRELQNETSVCLSVSRMVEAVWRQDPEFILNNKQKVSFKEEINLIQKQESKSEETDKAVGKMQTEKHT